MFESSMRPSDSDSSRFGLRVFRAAVDDIAPDQMITALLKESVDVLILRVPASRHPALRVLGTSGIPFMVADAQISYSWDMPQDATSPINQEISIRLARPDDVGAVSTLVRLLFDGYSHHYATNPLFPDEKVREGYVEWTTGVIARDDGLMLVAEAAGTLVAFAAFTIELGPAGPALVAVIHGIHPSAQGRGLYQDLLDAARVWGIEAGIHRMVMTTQIQNQPVQRAWTRRGLVPYRSELTVHVNALLGRPTREVPLTHPGCDALTEARWALAGSPHGERTTALSIAVMGEGPYDGLSVSDPVPTKDSTTLSVARLTKGDATAALVYATGR